MNRFIKCRLGAMLFLLMGLIAACGLAQEGSVHLKVEAGYDDTIIYGEIVPLRVTLSNEGDQTVSGNLCTDVRKNELDFDRQQLPVEIAPGETKEIVLEALPVHIQQTFRVWLEQDGVELVWSADEAENVVETQALAMGVLSKDGVLASALAVRSGRDVLGREEVITPIELDEQSFPTHIRQARAFDVLVIDQFDVANLGDDQQQTLETWLRGGGIVLLGTGSSRENSLDWFAAHTGVQASQQPVKADVLGAIMDYVKVSDKSGAVMLTDARPLTGGTALAIDEGNTMLASSPVGEGLVLTCAASLSSHTLLNAAQTDAIWQRTLIQADAKRYNNLFQWNNVSNAQYDKSLMINTQIQDKMGILPAAWLLAAYVLVAGFGLYIVLRKRDRSKLLWLAIPAASLIAVGAMGALGKSMGMNTPSVSSMHITHYDEDGTVTTEEQAHIGYAGQERMVISAAGDEPIERYESGYFYAYSTEEPDMRMRDRVTLGEHPSLELDCGATWLTRDLVIKSDRFPQGNVEATAYMEEDGLHAEITNNTDVLWEDAILMTSLGFADLGDIPAGGVVSVAMPRAEEVSFDAYGQELILPAETLHYPAELYRVSNACVDALSASGESDTYQETMLLNRLNLVNGGSQGIRCTLVALTPDVPCTQLLVNGEPVKRSVETSVLIKEIPFESVSPNGYIYLDQTVFEPYRAQLDEEGTPHLSEKLTQTGIDIEGIACFGYDLSGMQGEIEQIRVLGEVYGLYDAKSTVTLEVYSHEKDAWLALDDVMRTTIVGSFVKGAISEEGTLFLRYRVAEDVKGTQGVAPAIVVEGRK